ncbi:bacteriocin-type signal sequence-containing protein [Colwellia chukchiensis]|uniref:Bacteriocin-type signal sequence-containing protein n=2 Tax=Colwellia chukchiensis TaxID=641665 RepID=A0A1H7QJC2_9GAMM|nr:bacteriocin-type signal sequence-containing protein [Colwellia chukchiensis]
MREFNEIQELTTEEMKQVNGGYYLDNPGSEAGKTLNDLGELGVKLGSWLYDAWN